MLDVIYVPIPWHYVDFDSALLYFFRECNIINYGDMFDLSTQISWFGELET